MKEVFVPEYVKKKSESYEIARGNFNEFWPGDGIPQTVKNVSTDMYVAFENKITVQKNTFYSYTCAAKRELFGVAWDENGGSLGRCYTMMAKILEDGTIVPFNEEEQRINAELRAKYFGDMPEKWEFVKDLVRDGRIRKEDMGDYFDELNDGDNCYLSYQNELMERLDCCVGRFTRVERNETGRLDLV